MSRRDSPRTRRPAETVEGRENQLISLSMDLAERQMIEGTASAQVITHFLKLGSTREAKEQERLERENLLLSAKVAQIESQQQVEALYRDALRAMKQYSGQPDDDEMYEDDYYADP